MKISTRASIIVSAMLLSEISHAGPTEVTSVKNVRVRPHVAYVLFDGCAKYSKIYLESEYAKLMMSVALTAGAAGKPVEVAFQDDGGCQNVESTLTYLEIQF